MIDHKKANESEISEDLQEAHDESLESALIRFIKKLFSMFRMSCRFDEFLIKTGEYFDERILLTQKQKKMKYAGGKITFNLSGDNVEMKSKLFFLNEAEKWIVHESSNEVKKSRFNDWDTDKDLIRLSEGETIEFDINPPE
jgi:hypothetical protein